MKVLLISGHGAGDVGAVGNGYREADLTRELVNLIAERLRKYVSVDVYNQARNAFSDVQNGCFNASGYGYVLEVHFNAFNGAGHGTECYVTTSEAGITVEQAIMKRMGNFFTLRDNDSIFDGVKRTNFAVINTCKRRGMSGALLETCFINNASDINIYQKNKGKIADGIVAGIVEGFGLSGSGNSTSNNGNQTQKPSQPPKKSVDEIAREVIAGMWGNGSDRTARLQKAGYNASAVQNRVNEILGGKTSQPAKKSVDTIAREVIAGMWGNGADRKNRLAAAGYDYNAVQARVNQLL